VKSFWEFLSSSTQSIQALSFLVDFLSKH
jgi:hypothetical protein